MTGFGPLQALDQRLAAWEPCNLGGGGELAASQSAAPQTVGGVRVCVKKVNIHINVKKSWLLHSPTENGDLSTFPTLSPLSSTDRVQRADLLLHQHRGRVHPLPRRGLPEAGLPGDQGVHPGSPPLAEGEPAAGGGTGGSHLLLLFLLMYTHLSKLTRLSFRRNVSCSRCSRATSPWR